VSEFITVCFKLKEKKKKKFSKFSCFFFVINFSFSAKYKNPLRNLKLL